jgi:serine/threonine protein phosphatase 1
MRIIAIGDIHGCSTAFDSLLAAVKLQPDDKIITLGDYVDKGPDSKGVLNRLIALHDTGQLVALRGNHELMMLRSRDNSKSELYWRRSGGDKTLASYAIKPEAGQLADVPAKHWDFIENVCRDWWETDRHFFVHATAYPDMPMNEQPEYMLFWGEFDDSAPHFSGKIMVCGHTSQISGKPVNLGHAICIDTWVDGEGWLTGFDVRSGRVWQANQKGQQRTAWIDEFEPY